MEKAYTIQEVLKQLHISRATLYYRMKKLQPQLEPHVCVRNGKKYIWEAGLALLAEKTHLNEPISPNTLDTSFGLERLNTLDALDSSLDTLDGLESVNSSPSPAYASVSTDGNSVSGLDSTSDTLASSDTSKDLDSLDTSHGENAQTPHGTALDRLDTLDTSQDLDSSDRHLLKLLKEEHLFLKAQLLEKDRQIQMVLALTAVTRSAPREGQSILQGGASSSLPLLPLSPEKRPTRVYATFEQHIGPLSLEEARSLKEWQARGCDDALICTFIEKARQFHLPSFAYVHALLKRSSTQGIQTLDQLEAHHRESRTPLLDAHARPCPSG